MFAGAQQSGFISIFYSVGSNPLLIWDKQVKNGHIRRVIDDEVKSLVLDIGGTNVATTYITCPIKPRASLSVKLPYLVMIIKNMKKYFSFEIQILDDKDMRRRFRVSNFQSTTKVRPFCTTMPIGLGAGWNQVQFNLADFTKRAYGSMYMETVRVQIHANVRIRRIYFTDQLHSDEDLPNEFKLFAPGPKPPIKPKDRKTKEEAKAPPLPKEEEVPPPPSPAEESPRKEEEAPTPTEVAESEITITEPEAPAGSEVPIVEEEAKPAEEEAPAEEEELPAEEAEVPVEEEIPVEEAPPGEGEAAEEGVKEEGEPVEGETEGAVEEEAPVEGEGDQAEGETAQAEESEVAEEAEPEEAPVEVKEESETEPPTEEPTPGDVTEVTDTEEAPSEPATDAED